MDNVEKQIRAYIKAHKMILVVGIESVVLFIIGTLTLISSIPATSSWYRLGGLTAGILCIIFGFIEISLIWMEIIMRFMEIIMKNEEVNVYYKDYVNTVDAETKKLANNRIDNQKYKVDFMNYYNKTNFLVDNAYKETMKPLVLAVCLMLSLLDNKQFESEILNRNLALNCAFATVSKKQREAIDKEFNRIGLGLDAISMIEFVFIGKWTLEELVAVINFYETVSTSKALREMQKENN